MKLSQSARLALKVFVEIAEKQHAFARGTKSVVELVCSTKWQVHAQVVNKICEVLRGNNVARRTTIAVSGDQDTTYEQCMHILLERASVGIIRNSTVKC